MTDATVKINALTKRIETTKTALEQVMEQSIDLTKQAREAKTTAKRDYYKKKLGKSNKSLFDGLVMLRQYESLLEVYQQKQNDEDTQQPDLETTDESSVD